MTCNSARELVPLYVGGDLTDGRMAEVREHLAQCADCARELEKFESCRELVAEITAPELPRGQVQEMWASIRREIAVAPRPSIVRLQGFGLLKFAAILVIGVSVGYSFYAILTKLAPVETKVPSGPVEEISYINPDTKVSNATNTPGGSAVSPMPKSSTATVVINSPQQMRQDLLLRKLEEEMQTLRRQIVELQSQNEALTKRLIEMQSEHK